MNVFSKIVIVLFLLIQYVSASTKMKELEMMAQELFKVETMGMRFEAKESLLQEKTLLFAKMQKQVIEEQDLFEKVYVEGEMEVETIIPVKKNVYRVIFTVDGHRDSFMMVVHKSSKKIERYGRVEFLSMPERIYIDSRLQ